MPAAMYLLKAGLLCHDVRLNTMIQTTVMLDHRPTEKEALHLLWPIGEKEVARNYCEGCPFEFYYISIDLVEEQPPADQGASS